MQAQKIRTTALLAAIGAALALPLTASADPVEIWSNDGAAPVPHIPGTFAGSPTNDGPNGQFAATFDSTGFVGIGRPAEPPATIEVAPTNALRQVRNAGGNGNSAAAESTFSRFRAELRTLASRPPTTITAQR